MNQATITSAVIDRFHDEGFVILRGFLDAAIPAGVQAAVEQIVGEEIDTLLAAGKISDPCTGDPFATRLMHVFAQCPDEQPLTYRRELHRAGLFHLYFHPPLLDLVEAILGPEIRLYPNYSVRPKLPDNEATLVLWHQDAGYTASGRHGRDDDAQETAAAALRMVNVWSPLVPATVENGCMQFVPGTHKLGVVPHFTKNEYYLEIEAEYLRPRLSDAVNIELDPGDVVIFSNLLFHCGLPNTSGGIRWSCDWRYQDATQSTARAEHGHIARSRAHHEDAVQGPDDWERRVFE